MAAIEDPRFRTAQAIYAWYERNADDGHRPHLGASLIGHPCARHLWLTFRWAYGKKFSGRMLRLFNTGQREEARIVAELRAIGCEVHDAEPDGRQFRVETLGGHFSGSLDAAIKGLPEAPATWHVGEFKTHNEKSFADLKNNGVEKSKPMHYAQMMTYMGLTGMERAFYFAVNKDTDEIYTERIEFSQDKFKLLVERAESIIYAANPPARISEDPSWFQCKMCDHREICHGTQIAEPNCRTCAHVTPTRDGSWQCERHSRPLDVAAQKQACQAHRFIPILLERVGEQIDASQEENWVRYRNKKTGAQFTNGTPPAGFSSLEIQAAQDIGALDDADETLHALRDTFGGRVVA
jgi:hypothetical protein